MLALTKEAEVQCDLPKLEVVIFIVPKFSNHWLTVSCS